MFGPHFRRLALAAMISCGMWSAAPALAGPPYETDDAAAVETGSLEVMAFAQRLWTLEGSESAAGIDIGYGAFDDVQLTLLLPLGHAETLESPAAHGFGDIEVGVKHRILAQRDDSWVPDIAVHPVLRLPTADEGFGAGRVSGEMAIWAQKDFGSWSLFGGGGYAINPGPESRDATFAGIGLTKQVHERLSLGAEVYHQEASEPDGSSLIRVGLGASWALSEKLSLHGSVARGLRKVDETGRYALFLGLMLNH